MSYVALVCGVLIDMELLVAELVASKSLICGCACWRSKVLIAVW